jgi:hypothetical protein
MPVRDHEALGNRCELVGWDVAFDHARAVKSEEELESVRESVEINADGFRVFQDAYAPGRTAAEVLAPAEELFVERGCGRLTMNMVLVGAEFAIARAETVLDEFCIPSLEIAGPGGHWVEVSRVTAHGPHCTAAHELGDADAGQERLDGIRPRRPAAMSSPRSAAEAGSGSSSASGGSNRLSWVIAAREPSNPRAHGPTCLPTSARSGIRARVKQQLDAWPRRG